MLNVTSDKQECQQLMVERDKFPINIEAGNPFMLSQEFDFLSKEIPLMNPSHENNVQNLKHLKADEKVEIFRGKQIELASARLRRMPDNVQLLNNLGISYLNSGNYGAAIGHFRKALKIDETYFPCLANLAKAHFLKGEIDESLKIYRDIEKREPKSIQVLNNIANLLIAKKELTSAYEYLVRVIKLDGSNIAALSNIGTIFLLEKKFENAISFYRKALNIKSDLSGVLNNLGVCFSVMKSYKKAIKHLLAACSLNRQSVGYLLNLAQVYQEKGSHEDAIRILEDYLTRGYDDQRVRDTLAWSYTSMKEYQNALKQLNYSLKIAEGLENNSEQCARYYNNIATIYQCMNNYEIAEKYYNLSLESKVLNPPIPLYNAIELYFGENKDEHAKKLIDCGLVEFPNDPFILGNLGRYYFEVGNYEKSSEILNEVIAIEPKIINAFATLSVIEIEIRGNRERAHEILTKGLSFHPKEISLLNNLAYNYLMGNDTQNARQILDKIEIQDNIFVTATRGLLLIKEDNVQEGTHLYNMAISIASKNEDEKIVGLLEQKKYLELAKYQLRKGSNNEASRLLRKVLSLKAKFEYYRNEAKEILKGFE